MTNIAIQLFTYNQTIAALQLLRAVEVLVENHDKLRLVVPQHDGSRKTMALSKLVRMKEEGFRLNASYIQSPGKELSREARALGVIDVIIHFNISPDSYLWLPSSSLPASGRPVVRSAITGIQSLERAATYRKPKTIPNVLEVTFRCTPSNVENLVQPLSSTASRMWSRVDCPETYGTVDFGGEWLFFPTNGYNANVSPISVFECLEPLAEWEDWRQKHNMTIEPGEPSNARTTPKIIIHSLEQKQPLWS